MRLWLGARRGEDGTFGVILALFLVLRYSTPYILYASWTNTLDLVQYRKDVLKAKISR